LLSRAPTQEEQLTYLFALRGIRDGCTPTLRRAYFSWWGRDHLKANPAEHSAEVLGWFKQVEHGYGNGPAFKGFIENAYAEALQSVPADERGQLSGTFKPASPDSKPPAGPSRPLVKEWTVDDLTPDLSSVGKSRDFNNGRQIFQALCVTCHKLGDEGGAVGPELTGVASRYSREYILESILLPSKVISSQYANTIVRTTDGEVFEGRVIRESADKVVLRTSSTLSGDVEIQMSHIRSRELCKVSRMPAGLVNSFTRSDILDLLAWLESGQGGDDGRK
jgi:putative heme-binding domain-containing protein